MNEKLASGLIFIMCLLGIIILIGVSFIVNEGSIQCDCNNQEKR